MKHTVLNKDDVAKILREKGFDTENMSGVIITEFPVGKDPSYYKEKAGEVKRILEEIGYNASKGFCVVKMNEEKNNG